MSPSRKPEFPPLWPEAGFYPISLSELRKRCVDAFPLSTTREEIMTGLEKLVRRLVKAEVPGELWVDGSFTTEDIDPDDVDLLLHLPGDYWIEVLGETTQEKMRVIDWYCEEARRDTHKCDTHLWAEYPPDHPLYERNEEEREYWVGVYGESLSGVTKGIAVVELPGKLS